MNNQNDELNDEFRNAMLKMQMLRAKICRQQRLDDIDNMWGRKRYYAPLPSLTVACLVSIFYMTIIMAVGFFFPTLPKTVPAVLWVICIVHCFFILTERKD